MKLKWIILLIMVIILTQQADKKAGKFAFRCSDDKDSIELFNKDTGAFVSYESCAEDKECIVQNERAICVSKETETEKQAIAFSLWPIIASVLLILIIRRK